MKKVLFLIFASLLVLGACGNNDSEKKEDNKSSEHKKSNDSKKDKKSDDKKDNSKDNKKSESKNDDTTSIESQSTSKNDNGKSQDNNGNNERIQGKQATQQQNGDNQQVQGTPFNKDMPVAHDGGQNGYGYGDYLAAKEASEKARRGELQGVGGSWGVAPGQDFNSWRNQQAKIQTERAVPNE